MMNQSQIVHSLEGETLMEEMHHAASEEPTSTHKALPDMIEDQIIRGFQEELNRDAHDEAMKEVEESLK